MDFFQRLSDLGCGVITSVRRKSSRVCQGLYRLVPARTSASQVAADEVVNVGGLSLQSTFFLFFGCDDNVFIILRLSLLQVVIVGVGNSGYAKTPSEFSLHWLKAGYQCKWIHKTTTGNHRIFF